MTSRCRALLRGDDMSVLGMLLRAMEVEVGVRQNSSLNRASKATSADFEVVYALNTLRLVVASISR